MYILSIVNLFSYFHISQEIFNFGLIKPLPGKNATHTHILYAAVKEQSGLFSRISRNMRETSEKVNFNAIFLLNMAVELQFKGI